jgi:hypothetical protein
MKREKIMKLAGQAFVVAIALLLSSCATRSTAQRSAFAKFKETTAVSSEGLSLTMTGDFISSLQVIESVENVYKKDGIHIVVHTRLPSDKDSDDLKLRLLHIVIIPESVPRVFFGDEVIWEKNQHPTRALESGGTKAPAAQRL